MKRRGFFFIEFVGSMAVLAVVMTLAAQLTFRLFTLANQMAVAERDEAAIDQAVRLLRRDTEAATQASASGNTLTLGATVWTIDGNALVRTAGGKAQRFEPLPVSAFSMQSNVVIFKLGEAAWSFRPLLEHRAALSDGVPRTSNLVLAQSRQGQEYLSLAPRYCTDRRAAPAIGGRS